MNNDNRYNLNRISLIAKGQGAFLGAAVGDALGWPQEPEAKRADKKNAFSAESPVNEFQQWVRKSGGQYYPHEEVILAGEYSDDTQLILCTARSLLHGDQWWHHFTKRELPTWTRYERGGGGATKRAAQKWLAGQQPWFSIEKDKKQYFEAGGNGVAMRIMPHCLLGATDTDFGNIAKNIVANGVCTHGHPRALVGALAYGFAVWVAFQNTGTLPYGAIIEKVLSGVDSWSLLPDLDNICPSWRSSAFEVSGGQYEEYWQNTVREMLQFLELCQKGMKQGALPVEREILAKLGCFEKRMKGAGTVTAAASIFLASRFAVEPFHGILEAGFASGADTDTIASMTGGILGAVAGIEWLGNHTEQVQDAAYIRNLGERLAQKEVFDKSQLSDIAKTGKAHLDSLIEKLEASKIGDIFLFLDGRQAKISDYRKHQSLSQTTVAVSWKLTATDGQSLYVKKVSRSKTEISHIEVSTKEIDERGAEKINVMNMVVKLRVHDLEKARIFYENILGLRVEKNSNSLVKFGNIVLVPLEPHKKTEMSSDNRTSNIMRSTICIEVECLDVVYKNVRQFGAKILKDISEQKGWRRFTCFDPDGNAVEIDQLIC
ncbi:MULTISPECIES: ADP-ribosylglycohydrolase family protein [unclassified Microcoleus]|uniref:ADP-ribosylglycohydrolase family protein n=1 Tax=unclassified Microcoleus TaxID=2642155 RepID=UPI002FD76088